MHTSIRLPILLAAAVAAGGVTARLANAAPRSNAPASSTRSRAFGPCGYFPPQRESWPFRGLSRYRGGSYLPVSYGFFPTGFGYPIYSPFGGYGYGPFNPFAAGYGYGYPVLNSGYLNGGYYSPYTAPASITRQVVVVRPPAPDPFAEDSDAPRARRWSSDDSRFYLEPPSAPRPEAVKPKSAIETITSQLQVEQAEPGTFLVRWTGDASEVAWLDLQAVDGARQVLATRSLQEAPFKGLLSLPSSTAAVVLSVEYRSGRSISVKLPVAEFRALATP
jgi:hypothetical protein